MTRSRKSSSSALNDCLRYKRPVRPSENGCYDGQQSHLNRTLDELRRILSAIGDDLEELAPGLEIYAKEVFDALDSLHQVEDFYVNKAIPRDIVNLLSPLGGGPGGGYTGWRPELESVRNDAREQAASRQMCSLPSVSQNC